MGALYCSDAHIPIFMGFNYSQEPIGWATEFERSYLGGLETAVITFDIEIHAPYLHVDPKDFAGAIYATDLVRSIKNQKYPVPPHDRLVVENARIRSVNLVALPASPAIQTRNVEERKS